MIGRFFGVANPKAVLIPTLTELNPPGPKATAK